MSSPYFDDHSFDLVAAQAELRAFRLVLNNNLNLGEREHVLANFDKWPQLCSLFGTFHPRVNRANLVKREFKVGAHFIADLAVRKDGTDNVCLVEFEPAKPNDIFAARLQGRKIPPWASAMEKGFSQIVDWAWAIDSYRETPDFQDAFGGKRPNVMGVLVVGRSTSLSDNTRKDRWAWRSQFSKFDGLQGVVLQTYDELFEWFDIQLKDFAGQTTPTASTGQASAPQVQS
ncbi:Shedu anti-phage system protein SduA domain-containing protein [Caulobacter segnis]